MPILTPTLVNGRRVTVAGLGRFGGGVAVARWLVEQGANVTVTDADSEASLVESKAQLDGLPIRYQFAPQVMADFTGADLVVASPAVPPNDLFLQAATAANVPVTTEICLFVERCRNPIFGVTGTKGKSTTTALLGRMLASQKQTWVGGNIGVSLLADLPRIEAGDHVVLELSSYMLHHLGRRQFSPHVAVVTLLLEDHLKWHGSSQAYRDAKRNVLRFQSSDDVAVLNQSHAPTAAMASETPAAISWFGENPDPRFELAVAGEHNQLNAQAAFAAAKVVGVPFDAAQAAVRNFVGLPHRLQRVCVRRGVSYVNDSIATIPEAAVAALASYPEKCVIQIVGGSKKKDPPIDTMCIALASRAKAVLCIGETGPKIAARLRELGAAPTELETVERATALAAKLARAGDIVLLSPGYASHDQFVNFQQRGDVFEKLARSLPNEDQ